MITAQSADGTQHQFPDGTDPAVIDKVMKAYAMKSAPPPPQQAGPQPSTLDKIVASPIGRAVHDSVIAPLEGAASGMGALVNPFIRFLPAMAMQAAGIKNAPMSVGGALNTVSEQPYQNALAANRNTPGYAAARASADAATSKRGSGFRDQVTSGLNPALAGIAALPGGLDASNAAADSQAAAQANYQKAHPLLSMGANALGGLLMMPERGPLPEIPTKPDIPSITDLKQAADAAYKTVDNSGLVVSGPSYDKMVDDLQTALSKKGIDPALHPDATAALNRLVALKGQEAVPFQDINTMREIAGDAAGAQQPRDAFRGGLIQDHIDDFVDNLKPSDLVGGETDPSATVNALNNARDQWSRAKQAETIQSAIDKAGIKAGAYSQSGDENAIRAQFRQLALNDRQMSRLAPDVQQAVKDVASGGPMSNVLRAIGKYAPHGPVATAAGAALGGGFGALADGLLGGAVGANAGMVALPAIGEAARAGATSMTMAAAQRALETAALGRFPVAAESALHLPSLTAQSRVPLLLAPMLAQRLQPQPQTRPF